MSYILVSKALQWLPPPHPATYHTFPVVYPFQILIELLSDIKLHGVAPEGTEGPDDEVIAILVDVFVAEHQGGKFPNGDIYI